jgi:hypothetical protein
VCLLCWAKARACSVVLFLKLCVCVRVCVGGWMNVDKERKHICMYVNIDTHTHTHKYIPRARSKHVMGVALTLSSVSLCGCVCVSICM